MRQLHVSSIILVVLAYLTSLRSFSVKQKQSSSSSSSRDLLRVFASTKATTSTVANSPRKALFFELVESGLTDRWPTLVDSLPRIANFVKYAKGEVPFPRPPASTMHDPCEEYIDDLTAMPWWPSEKFDWVQGLEAQSGAIRAELEQVLAQQELFRGDSRYMNTMGAGWTAFRLQRLGEWNSANVALFPETTRIVQNLDIPLAVRGVMFAKQNPNSGVQPHSDGRNFILTCHLGIKIPSQVGACWMSVGGEKRPWQQDKCSIFDTSFTHETGNESSEDRYVLIIDFWHPELTRDERKALEFVYDTRNKFETGRAKDIVCSWVTKGKPLDTDAYIKSKKGVGAGVADFFAGGGLIKFNPFQK